MKRIYAKSRRLLICCAIIISYAASCKSSDNTVAPRPDPPDTTGQEPAIPFLYSQNTHGYEAYRIPAIIKTKKGTLLAFAEARKKRSAGDAGDIDLVSFPMQPAAYQGLMRVLHLRSFHWTTLNNSN